MKITYVFFGHILTCRIKLCIFKKATVSCSIWKCIRQIFLSFFFLKFSNIFIDCLRMPYYES